MFTLTRPSHSIELFQPSINLTKTGDALSKIGDTVDYAITLFNTSSADTPDLTCTVTDALLDLDETFTIAAGAPGYVISVVDFVIPAGAADPFVNTASVTCSPAGFPNIYTDTASHSINLFQPSITFTKTGDTLSKIGDPVNYVITLNNTSSADTPDLVCTITDLPIGVNKSVTLPSGESDVTNVTFTIPPGASDPYINTASVSCSPTGFPNVYGGTSTWSTNLFQPDVEIIKSGPALAAEGDVVTYTFTINNLSSATARTWCWRASSTTSWRSIWTEDITAAGAGWLAAATWLTRVPAPSPRPTRSR